MVKRKLLCGQLPARDGVTSAALLCHATSKRPRRAEPAERVISRAPRTLGASGSLSEWRQLWPIEYDSVSGGTVRQKL